MQTWLLVDAQLPDVEDAQATRLIKLNSPNVKVIVLAVHASHAELAQESGADCRLPKDCPRRELLEAVHNLAVETGST
jgi:DNA-binding NarL/FixJ family response regulator